MATNSSSSSTPKFESNGEVSLNTGEEAMAAMQTNFPSFTFTFGTKGQIEREFGGQSRRVCCHNNRPIRCNHCSHLYVADETIGKTGAPQPKFGPLTVEQSDPLAGRIHAEAPIIPAGFSEKFIAEQRERLNALGTRHPNGCITFNGHKFLDGNGSISFRNQTMMTHIVSWMLQHNRLVPKPFIIRHKCQTPGCYEPKCLEIGSNRQNMLEDKLRDGTLQHGEKNHFAKITAETAKAIYNSKGEGTRAQRAVKFGVTVRQVACIDEGITWGHETGKVSGMIQRRDYQKKKRDEMPRSAASREQWDAVWKKALEHSRPGPNGCLESTYQKNASGYANISMLCHNVLVHKFSWEYNKNNCQVAPDGVVIRHKCDNPACFLPDHLESGTQSDNINDQFARGRRKRARKEAEDESLIFEQESIVIAPAAIAEAGSKE